jgi:hypothetical protein
VFSKLLPALDFVVLERLPGGALLQLGGQPAPAWFVATFGGIGHREPVTLLQAFPVLDAFMSDAEMFWGRNENGRLESEAFVVTGAGGLNIPIAAIAVVVDGRQFLVLQRAAGFDDRQQLLQRARERALAYEQLVMRIHLLRRPVEALAAVATQLEDARVSGEVETLRKVLDDLPKLPPAAAARR